MEDGTEISNRNILIESMAINHILMGEEQLKFGCCNAAQFSITVAETSKIETESRINVLIEAEGEQLPLGIFNVLSCEKIANQPFFKITALDDMDRINVDVSEWYRNLIFPINLHDFRNSLFKYMGIEQDEQSLPFDNLIIEKTLTIENELNARRIVENICEINACFGSIDRWGRFKYVFLESAGLYPSETLYPSEELYPSESGNGTSEISSTYISVFHSDFMTQNISKVVTADKNGSVVAVGDGDNTYLIDDNFLLYNRNAEELKTIAEGFLKRADGITYVPAEIKSKGLPYLEVGDSIKLVTNEDTIETYIFSRHLTGIQSLIDNYSAEGEEYLYNDLNSIDKKILNLNYATEEMKINVEKTYDGLIAEATRAKEEEERLSSKINLTSEQISAEVTRAKGREDELSAAINVTSEQISTKVSKGNVSSEISQEAGAISIGAERLIVTTRNWSLDKYGEQTLKDNNGNVVVNIGHNGITLSNGASLISSNGVVGDMTYVTSSVPNECQLGFSGDIGYGFVKKEIILPLYIPSGYVITSATVILSTLAAKYHLVTGVNVEEVVTGYPRGIEMYIGKSQAFLEGYWNGACTFVMVGGTLVRSGGFVAGVNGSNSTTTPKEIVSGDVKGYLSQGFNAIRFSVNSDYGTTNKYYAERTGTAYGIVNIKGYLKN